MRLILWCFRIVGHRGTSPVLMSTTLVLPVECLRLHGDRQPSKANTIDFETVSQKSCYNLKCEPQDYCRNYCWCHTAKEASSWFWTPIKHSCALPAVRYRTAYAVCIILHVSNAYPRARHCAARKPGTDFRFSSANKYEMLRYEA